MVGYGPGIAQNLWPGQDSGHPGCLEQEVRESRLSDTRFANRLIPERGLALGVYDIITAEDGRVTWGNGEMFYKGARWSAS